MKLLLPLLILSTLVISGCGTKTEPEPTKNIVWFCEVYSDEKTPASSYKLDKKPSEVSLYMAERMESLVILPRENGYMRINYIRTFEVSEYQEHKKRLKNRFNMKDYCLKTYILLPEGFDDSPPSK